MPDVGTAREGGHRVLLVTGSGNLLGGAEYCLVEMADRMRGEGWQPVVVVPARGSLRDALQDRGVDCRVIELGTLRHRGESGSPVVLWRLLQSLIAALRLRRVIRRQDIDVVHSNSAVVVAGAMAARMAKVPHVWHVREVLSGRLWPPLRRFILANSRVVVCISETVATAVVPGPGFGSRVVVVRDGVDLEHFSPRRQGDGPPLVTVVGRLNPIKGQDVFLAAAAMVAESHPDARFVVAGGHLPVHERLASELRATADQEPLAGRVDFPGQVSRAALADLLARTSVLALPSTWAEGGGLTMLEAMAAGVPVVAAGHGGPAEIIEDGVTGLLVPPGDPAALAAAIGRLLSDPALAQDIATNARAVVAEGHDVRRQTSRIVAIYGGLVAARGPDVA